MSTLEDDDPDLAAFLVNPKPHIYKVRNGPWIALLSGRPFLDRRAMEFVMKLNLKGR
jgi:hypothetical protein